MNCAKIPKVAKKKWPAGWWSFFYPIFFDFDFFCPNNDPRQVAPPPFRSLPLQVGGLPHLDAVHPPAIEPPSTSKNKPGVFIIGEVHFPPAPWSCVNLACQFVGFMLFWFKPTHPLFLKILKNIPHDTPTHPGGRPGLDECQTFLSRRTSKLVELTPFPPVSFFQHTT